MNFQFLHTEISDECTTPKFLSLFSVERTFFKKHFYTLFIWKKKNIYKYPYSYSPYCSYYKTKYLHLSLVLQHSRWAPQFPSKSLRRYPGLEYYWTHQTREVSLLGFLSVCHFKLQLFQVREQLFTSLQLLADVLKPLLSDGSPQSRQCKFIP